MDYATWWSALQIEEQTHPPFGTRPLDIKSAHYLLWVRKGRLRIRVGAHEAVLGPGRLAAAPAGRERMYGGLGARSTTVELVRLRSRGFTMEPEGDGPAWAVVTAIGRRVAIHGPAIPVPKSARAGIEAILAEMRAEQAEQAYAYWAALKGNGLRLLAALGRLPAVAEALASGPGRELAAGPAGQGLREVLWTVDERYGENLTVAAMAKLAHLSRGHFQRRFREEVGMPFHEYLTRQRVARACALLRESDETILAIAQEVGFGSLSRLYAAFKRYVGRPPAALRRGDG